MIVLVTAAACHHHMLGSDSLHNPLGTPLGTTKGNYEEPHTTGSAAQHSTAQHSTAQHSTGPKVAQPACTQPAPNALLKEQAESSDTSVPAQLSSIR
jgi:hypothetical protein